MTSVGSSRVFLIRNVAPGNYGGGETYQLKVGKKLKEAGFEVFIVTASRELLRVAKTNGFKVIRAPYLERQNWSGWRNILLPVYFWRQHRLKKWYCKMFKMYKPDAVNIQSRDEWIAATMAAKKLKVPVVWTDHIDFRTWVLQNVKVPGKNLIGKWVLRCAKYAEKIIMVSDFERKFFENTIGKFENVITIKNGVEDRYYEYKGIRALPESFCYVGRIVDYKGIDEMLRAFKRMQKANPKATLNIYGDGKDMAKYRKMAENIANVNFMGHTDEPLLAIAQNAVFVLPSYYEGLSMSLLDAAMMERTIIVSDVDGNPEVVKNSQMGFLVPAKNVEKLEAAMVEALDIKKARLLAKNVRKNYKEEFDFDKIFAEKMLPLYNNLKGDN